MALANDSNTIPMTVTQTNKFYEPVILLKALNIEMAKLADYTNPADFDRSEDPRKLLQIYIYKLAHVCDSQKGHGGATITSFVVFQITQEQRVKYWFASNQRTDYQLKQTAVFVESLLKELNSLPRWFSLHPKEAYDSLLRKILLFNKDRVNYYLQALRSEANKCFRNCTHWGAEEKLSITKYLEEILQILGFDDDSVLYDQQIRKCELVINALRDFIHSASWHSLERFARDGRAEPAEPMGCWPEIRHVINRIMSYPQAVGFFLVVKGHWPQLFQNPEVVYSESSRPMFPRPGREKSYTAAGIVGRMTRKPKDIRIFKDLVEELQLYSLDQRIKSEFGKDTFHPIVHSEINLLHALDKQGLLNPMNFFQGAMYIGSSKPPCRLCEYYFEEHKSGVGLRKGHKNLYPSWRVPDVLQAEGTEGETRRQIMIDRMLVRVRKDAFDLIRKKVKPTYRDHDSVTSSARLTHVRDWFVGFDSEDLASTMGEMGLEHEDDDDDDDSGGVRL